MTVKITGAKDSLMWYADHIGETWEVYEDCGNEYKCRAADGYINFILKQDCEVCDE